MSEFSGPPAEPAGDSREHAWRLFMLLHSLPAGPERTQLRHRLVELHLPIAHYCARWYAGRGETLDDLRQVAAIGLINAVDRFDPARTVEFSTFAVPTIVGEIRRHFRDRTWSVHVPRDLQELTADVRRCSARLMQEAGRSPTVGELALRLGRSEERIIEALGCAASGAFAAGSLSSPAGADRTVADTLGGADPGYRHVETQLALGTVIARLPERERRILVLRYYGDQSQSEIARQLGISQMHVSRLLSRALGRLGAEMA